MDSPFSQRTPFFSMKIALDLPSSFMLPFPPCRAPRRGLRFLSNIIVLINGYQVLTFIRHLF